MKKITMIALLGLVSFSLSANEFYYTEGVAKGKKLSENVGYIDVYEFCFTGNGFKAQSKLYKLFNDENNESVDDVYTKYSVDDDLINYGFVEVGCTDEGYSKSDCWKEFISNRCK